MRLSLTAWKVRKACPNFGLKIGVEDFGPFGEVDLYASGALPVGFRKVRHGVNWPCFRSFS